VRRAVEVSDPDGRDPALGRLEEQLEDDDEPVTAVENLEERLALAAEGADFEGEDPAVAVASAVVLYLASKQGQESYDRDPSELRRLAVRAEWHGDPPSYVADWLGGKALRRFAIEASFRSSSISAARGVRTGAAKTAPLPRSRSLTRRSCVSSNATVIGAAPELEGLTGTSQRAVAPELRRAAVDAEAIVS
jgi:hypothetical protein